MMLHRPRDNARVALGQLQHLRADIAVAEIHANPASDSRTPLPNLCQISPAEHSAQCRNDTAVGPQTRGHLANIVKERCCDDPRVVGGLRRTIACAIVEIARRSAVAADCKLRLHPAGNLNCMTAVRVSHLQKEPLFTRRELRQRPGPFGRRRWPRPQRSEKAASAMRWTKCTKTLEARHYSDPRADALSRPTAPLSRSRVDT
jgi:hypothetical protein